MKRQNVRSTGPRPLKEVTKVPTRELESLKNDSTILRRLRALYIAVYNDERSLIPQAVELFHALGTLLEGVTIPELECHAINKIEVLKELNTGENNGKEE